MSKPVFSDKFVFNPEINGGEQLVLKTDFFDNGDAKAGLPGGIYTIQTLTLNSYGSSASFNVFGAFTPKNLRELANILESGMIYAENCVKP